jgi:5-methylcytosine-specific restriction endonuclease McrA
LRRRFGSWNAALDKAGLSVKKRARVPDDELFANLETIWRSLGRQPRYRDLDVIPTSANKSLYACRFGTWRKALEAFVAWANASPETEEFTATPKVNLGRRSSREPSLRLRFRVMRRDGFKCRQCGRSPATEAGVVLHIDHVLAWATGGETVEENLQTLCDRCNLGKSCLPAGGGVGTLTT